MDSTKLSQCMALSEILNSVSPFNYAENGLIWRCFRQFIVEYLLLISIFALSKARSRCFLCVLPNHEIILFAFSGTLGNALLVDSS